MSLSPIKVSYSLCYVNQDIVFFRSEKSYENTRTDEPVVNFNFCINKLTKHKTLHI